MQGVPLAVLSDLVVVRQSRMPLASRCRRNRVCVFDGGDADVDAADGFLDQGELDSLPQEQSDGRMAKGC